MIPASIEAIAGFLLLTAPGALYYLQRSRFVPPSKDTVLAEASRVALASVVATAVAAFALQHMWWPIAQRVQQGTDVDLWRLGSAAASTTALACLLVMAIVLVCWRVHHAKGLVSGLQWVPVFFGWSGYGGDAIDEGRVWHHVLVGRRPTCATEAPYLTVELTDGSRWRGTYLGHDTDAEPTDRSLALGQPQISVMRDGKDEFAVKRQTDAVILQESQIRSIQVQYLTKAEMAAARSALQSAD